MDPEKMNVRQLMSALSAAGVELPPQKMNKAYYVELFRKNILEKQVDQNSSGDDSESDSDDSDISIDDDSSTEDEPEHMTRASKASRTKITKRTPSAVDRKRRRAPSGNGAADDGDESTEEQEGYEADMSQSIEVSKKTQAQDRRKKRRTATPAAPIVTAATTTIAASRTVTSRETVNSIPANIFQTGQSTPQRTEEKPGSQTPQTQSKTPVLRESTPQKSTPHLQTPEMRTPEMRLPQMQTPEMRPRFTTPRTSSAYVNPNLLSAGIIGSSSAGIIGTTPRTSIAPSSVRSPISPFTPSQVNPKPRDPVKSFFLNLITAVVWGLLFVCLFLAISKRGIDPSMPHGLPYCDTEAGGLMLKLDQPQDNCQPCPRFGYCARGRLEECEKSFVIKNAICVEDERITESAMSMIDVLQKDLSIQAGEYECNPGAYKFKGLLLEDAYTMLEKKKLHPEDEFDVCFKKVMSLIDESGQNLELSVVEVELEIEQPTPASLEEETAEDQLPELQEEQSTEEEQKKEEPVKTVKVEKKRMIYSTYPQIPIMCRMTRKIQENITYIGGGIAFLLIIFLGNIWKNRIERAKREKEDLVSMVLTYLKENESYTIVHLRDEIKEQFNDVMDVMKHWPDVEEEVRNDGRVSEVLGEHDARVWVWAAPTSTSSGVSS